MSRQIVHLNLIDFFINATLLHQPKMAGRPLIIGGTSSRGIVESASQEAQRMGVQTGMPTRVALHRCPEATVLKGDIDLFASISQQINEILSERTPLYEQSTMGEFYIDMSGMDKFLGVELFLSELLQYIKKEIGLNSSYGLSINKTVAKMCTNYSQPRHLAVTPQEVQPFLDPQSIRAIPSLGSVAYKTLRRISVKLIHTLRQIPGNSIFELLGKPGLNLWRKAHGKDDTPVVPYNAQSKLHIEKKFDHDTQDIVQIKSLIVELIETLAFELRSKNQLCSTIIVKLRYSNGDTEKAQTKISFTADDQILAKAAEALFLQLYSRRMLIRLLGITLTNLVRGNLQIDLFQSDARLIPLYQAIDRMKQRFNDPKLIRRANGINDLKVAN